MINSYEELVAWTKECRKKRLELGGVHTNAVVVTSGVNSLPAAEPGLTPPKQNTDEIGHWSTLVTEFHSKVADTMLDYVYLTSDYTRGMFMLDFATEFAPKPDGLIIEKRPDGWVKIKGGLPPEEYKKLVGAQQWETIESKYESEKYLVYDNEQEKDPATQLFPEFKLMFRSGCYIKWSFRKFDGDSQPKLTLEFKSAKEM